MIGVAALGCDLPSAVEPKTTLCVRLSLKKLRITNNDTRQRSQRNSYDKLNHKNRIKQSKRLTNKQKAVHKTKMDKK
ncbi:hypothetical protein TUM3811_05820 [Shewanella algae]|nr:hypothetical protein TUM3811_05820 [Shewanella algae]